MESLDHEIVSGSISFTYNPIPKGRNHLNIAMLLLPTAGTEPRPPAQHASVLSIAPLPLGNLIFTCIYKIADTFMRQTVPPDATPGSTNKDFSFLFECHVS